MSSFHSSSPSPNDGDAKLVDKLCADDILTSHVGDFGPAQWLHFSIASFAWAVEALHALVTIFADKSPTPICTNSTGLSIPCTSASVCSMEPSHWDWQNPDSSTVATFNLICGHQFKLGLVQALFFVGALFGAGIFGRLADSVAGRKGALRISCLGSGICGLLTAYSPNFWVYAVLRTLTGLMSVGGIGLSSFVLATEPIGVSRRGMVGMSTLYFFSLGTITLTGVAKLSTDSWRRLYILTSIPSFVYIFLLLPLVHESPRWLLIRGRRDEAMHVLHDFARRNGRVIPGNVAVVTEVERADSESPPKNDDSLVSTGTVLDVFKQAKLRLRLLVMVIIWFTAAIVYYGVSFNVSNTGFDIYTSVLINALVELPAFAITAILLGRIGRRNMLVAAMGISGISCTIGSILTASLSQPGVTGAVGLVSGAMGIFGIAGAYNLLFVYTSELFPTVVRNAAMGLASQAGQIGAIGSPLIVQMAGVHRAVPFGVLALAGMAGAFLGAWLPETVNQPLFETLEGIVDASEKNAASQPLLA